MIEGYVKVWRRYFYSADWLAPRKFSPQEAYLDLIAQASFADRIVQLGDGRQVELYKGEVLASQRQLAKRWGWSQPAVHRYLHKMAEATPPMLECYTRKVVVLLAESPIESPIESAVTIVKLSNYGDSESDNALSVSGCVSGNVSRNESIYNKEYIRENNNTHTDCNYLVKFFERARAMRTREDAPELERCARLAAEQCTEREDVRTMHDRLSRAERGYLWLWSSHGTLQRCFAKPCTPRDFVEIDRGYEVEDVKRVVEAMANKIPQSGGMLGSFATTFKQWAMLDHRIKQKADLGNPRYARLSN